MKAKSQISGFKKALTKTVLVGSALIAVGFMTACSSPEPYEGKSPADLVREERVAKILESLHQRNSDEVDHMPFWTEENERNYANAVDSTDLIYDENTQGFIKHVEPVNQNSNDAVVTDSSNELKPEDKGTEINNDSNVAPSSKSSDVVTENAPNEAQLKKTEQKAGLSLKEAAALATSQRLNRSTIVPLNKRIELANPPAPSHAPFTTYSERKDNPDPNLRRLPDERDYPLQPFKNPIYHDNTPGTYQYRTYRQYNSTMESQVGSRAGNYFGQQ